MIVRPYGIVIEGTLELGLELLREESVIVIRPHTGVPEPFVLSNGFANCHSHLEYFGMSELSSEGLSYWPWIRKLTQLKKNQTAGEIERDCKLAAMQNYASGVRFIEEHSDRPFAGGAIHEAGMRGIVYQEVITLSEAENSDDKIAAVQKCAEINRQFLDTFLNPHATYTVDKSTLARFGRGDLSGAPLSIHMLESQVERQFFKTNTGPIAELYEAFGISPPIQGMSPIDYLDELGLLSENLQAVHCCDIDDREIELLAQRKVRVAHCPRSNANLNCPIAPVRRMIDAGISVGIGMDSAASSGPVDMFEEMREAIRSSQKLAEPIAAETCWRIATHAESWIKVNVDGVRTTEELLQRATPTHVEPLIL